MQIQAFFALLFTSGAIAVVNPIDARITYAIRPSSYIPTDPARIHQKPEEFPWPDLIGEGSGYKGTTPKTWYYPIDPEGLIKIWIDDRGSIYTRDSTKFDNYDQCIAHCCKYGTILTSQVDQPNPEKCKYHCNVINPLLYNEPKPFQWPWNKQTAETGQQTAKTGQGRQSGHVGEPSYSYRWGHNTFISPYGSLLRKI